MFRSHKLYPLHTEPSTLQRHCLYAVVSCTKRVIQPKHSRWAIRALFIRFNSIQTSRSVTDRREYQIPVKFQKDIQYLEQPRVAKYFDTWRPQFNILPLLCPFFLLISLITFGTLQHQQKIMLTCVLRNRIRIGLLQCTTVSFSTAGQNKNHYDIVIVGGGMVGGTMASALGRYSI